MVVVIASFAGVRATRVAFAHFPHNVVSIVETWVDWYTIYSDSNSAGNWKTNANIHYSNLRGSSQQTIAAMQAQNDPHPLQRPLSEEA